MSKTTLKFSLSFVFQIHKEFVLFNIKLLYMLCFLKLIKKSFLWLLRKLYNLIGIELYLCLFCSSSNEGYKFLFASFNLINIQFQVKLEDSPIATSLRHKRELKVLKSLFVPQFAPRSTPVVSRFDDVIIDASSSYDPDGLVKPRFLFYILKKKIYYLFKILVFCKQLIPYIYIKSKVFCLF